MPCMKMCCFYLSTRLGSIIVGILSILQVLIPALILVANGGEGYLKAGASDINSHINDFGQEELFISFLRFTEKDPEIVFLAAETFCGVHLLSCILMIVGALKVQRYLLLPFIVLDVIRLCVLSLIHVTGMMVIKKQLNLGDLIAITIAGGFGLLLLFYMWACVVALYQIFGIVTTEKYRSMFGNDPTTPARIPTETVNSKDLRPVKKAENSLYSYNSNYANEYPTYNQNEHYR
nr:uncharacterized protein LOC109427849 [Aedes albopictus]